MPAYLVLLVKDLGRLKERIVYKYRRQDMLPCFSKENHTTLYTIVMGKFRWHPASFTLSAGNILLFT